MGSGRRGGRVGRGAGGCRGRCGGRTTAADAAMRARVRDDDLVGGVLFVARDGDTLHRVAVGNTTARTVMPIASASKWLTSATVMTFVDEGKLRLDDPVRRVPPRVRRRQGGHHRARAPLAHHRAAAGRMRGRPVDDLARGARRRSPPAAIRRRCRARSSTTAASASRSRVDWWNDWRARRSSRRSRTASRNHWG